MNSIADLIKKIPNLSLTSVNNWIPIYGSYLAMAVHYDHIESIKEILKIGGNPDGITSSGLIHRTPMTLLGNKRGTYFWELIPILLAGGANINGEDLQGDSILTILILGYIVKDDVTEIEKMIIYLLDHGANPDGTIFANPLYMLGQKLYKGVSLKKVKNLITLFLLYGANSRQNYIMLVGKNNQYDPLGPQNRILTPQLSKHFKKYNKMTEVKLLEECKDTDLIRHLAKYYKIPITNKIDLKALCKCITEIKKDVKEYDENTFVELRNRLRKQKCSNEDLLLGANAGSYLDEELVYLPDKNNTWCFHTSEIPVLLSTRKNPYTSVELTPEVLQELVTKYHHAVPKTLEESLKGVYNEDPIQEINNEILLQKLTFYIRSFNTYMQPEKMKDMTMADLVELQNMLAQGNDNIIYNTFSNQDRMKMTWETKEAGQKRILGRTVTYLILHLQNFQNGTTLPFVANVIEQACRDAECAHDIISLVPETMRYHISNAIDDEMGLDFMKYMENKGLVEYLSQERKFWNSLSEEEKNIYPHLDRREQEKICLGYLHKSVEDLLKLRYGEEMPLLIGWEQIVPWILRNLP